MDLFTLNFCESFNIKLVARFVVVSSHLNFGGKGSLGNGVAALVMQMLVCAKSPRTHNVFLVCIKFPQDRPSNGGDNGAKRSMAANLHEIVLN